MDLQIADRVALVCSSTAGLGLATAKALAADGCRVVVTGRRGDVAREAAAELGSGSFGLAVDLARPGAADELADAVLAETGRIDILVLNGPGPAPSAAADLDPEALHAAIGLLADNQVGLVRRALPGMRERGWGRVVAIGSSGVDAPLPNLAASNFGRAALAAYLKTLSSEVAADGVTVNMVLPGRIATDRVATLDARAAERTGRPAEEVRRESESAIPTRRYGRPEEFGDVVAFLCGAPASYVTGTTVRCDGGLVPTL
jgi:3-oxoacyl-[acyl-carrier protein] reductase